MFSPTTPTEKRDDIRRLAAIDKRHGFLKDVDEGWFDRTGLTILTERAEDGTPLVGVMLEYPSVCPEDETAEMQIKYWLADLTRRDDIGAAFVRNIAAINDEMVRLGTKRVWGLVPKNARHLRLLLDPIAEAGKCERVDGALTVDAAGTDYARFYFYFGNRTDVNDKVQGTA